MPSGVTSASLLGPHDDVRRGLDEAEDAQPALALDDGPDRAVLELDDLGDLGQRSDRVQLGRIVDLLALGLALGDQRDGSAGGDGRVQRGDALLASNLERHDHLGEDDRLAQGDERQLARTRMADVFFRRRLGGRRSVCGCGRGLAGGGLVVVDALLVFDVLHVILVGRPVTHWSLLIEVSPLVWPLYV